MKIHMYMALMIVMIALCRVMLFFARPNFSAKNHVDRVRSIEIIIDYLYFISLDKYFNDISAAKISSGIFLQNAIKWKKKWYVWLQY